MNYKVSFALLTLGDTLGVILCVPGLLKDLLWLLIAGAAVLVLSTAQALIFLRCPRCRKFLGLRWAKPERCPKCGGPIKRVGTGTQKVQEELARLFGDLKVDRMDADTVSATNTHENILDHFKKEQIPILLGTQMVAKGLNLPNVTLVGVLDADLGLYSDNYRAAETTFNMLTQVVGRAGRGDCAGKAVVQTMVPEHKVLKLAAEQDYAGFYRLELELRRVQQCPPFGDVALITFTGKEEAAVLRGAVKFRDSLRKLLKQPDYAKEQAVCLGPAPCPVAKINYNYRYRLTLRCRMTKPLRLLLAHLLRQFAQDKENRGVSAFIDINGFD